MTTKTVLIECNLFGTMLDCEVEYSSCEDGDFALETLVIVTDSFSDINATQLLFNKSIYEYILNEINEVNCV